MLLGRTTRGFWTKQPVSAEKSVLAESPKEEKAEKPKPEAESQKPADGQGLHRRGRAGGSDEELSDDFIVCYNHHGLDI